MSVTNLKASDATIKNAILNNPAAMTLLRSPIDTGLGGGVPSQGLNRGSHGQLLSAEEAAHAIQLQAGSGDPG